MTSGSFDMLLIKDGRTYLDETIASENNPMPFKSATKIISGLK